MSGWLSGALALALLAAGCAGGQPARRGEARQAADQYDQVEGTLIEARHYFDTGAIGEDHTLCAELSARAELPLGVLTRDGVVVMITAQPSRLAAYVTRSVRVTGQLTANGQLLQPRALQVWDGARWVPGAM